MKIRGSIAKRFKVTKTGKVTHRSSFNRHLKTQKNKAQKRSLNQTKLLRKSLANKIIKLMGKKKGTQYEDKDRTLKTKKA